MILKYLKNILISFDQFINTLAGGDPDETISARLGRNWKGTWMYRFVDFLFSWQKREGSTSHCENAHWWEQDEGKDQIIALKDKNNKNLG
jgi:hypothetical protein